MKGATVNELAIVLARREGLLDEETGEIACWRCKGPGALLPTLRCRRCVGLSAIPPRPPAPAPAREYVEDRWIQAADRLRDDPSMTLDRARQMLERARRANDATPAKLAQLQALIDRRFPPQLSLGGALKRAAR